MFRWLSLSPKVAKRDGRIIVRSNRLLWLLMLGAASRTFWVEPAKKRFRVQSRSWWLRRRRQKIAFSSVAAVTYGYSDMSVAQHTSWAHNSFDCFSVGLRFFDQSEQHLFHFYGNGTFSNNSPLPDWFFWDDFAFDVAGTQQSDSRAFVDLLAEMTGTTVVPPRDY